MWLDLFLTNIEALHPGAKQLLKKGGIAAPRSLIPGALTAVEKTMEETFMKFAKSAGKQCGKSSLLSLLWLLAICLKFFLHCNSRWIFWAVFDVWRIPEMVSNNIDSGTIPRKHA